MTIFKHLLLVICISTFTRASAQPSLFSREVYKSTNGDSLNYRLLYPDYDTSRKYPLVIFLHGSGERGTDNDAQLKWGAMSFATSQNMKLHPCLVIAPQCPNDMSWANFSENHTRNISLLPTPTRPMQLLMQLIQQAIRTLPVDTNRIYITGLSMGGYGTFDAMERYPKMFAAAVPVCGGGDASRAASIAHIPTWIFAGAEDPAVDPILSIDMLTALRKAGAHPGFTLYPEVGHFSWIAAYTDEMMMEWLFRQHK